MRFVNECLPCGYAQSAGKARSEGRNGANQVARALLIGSAATTHSTGCSTLSAASLKIGVECLHEIIVGTAKQLFVNGIESALLPQTSPIPISNSKPIIVLFQGK